MTDPMTTLQATGKISDDRETINENFEARHDWADESQSADYQMLEGDEAIYVDASGATRKVTLLDTADARANQRVLIYAEDGTNTITIEVKNVGTETIGVGAATSMTLTADEHFVELIRKGTGTAWYPLARRP